MACDPMNLSVGVSPPSLCMKSTRIFSYLENTGEGGRERGREGEREKERGDGGRKGGRKREIKQHFKVYCANNDWH